MKTEDSLCLEKMIQTTRINWKRETTTYFKQLDCTYSALITVTTWIFSTKPFLRIVGGMYINISLHDYIRGITNIHHAKSTWTLDPRIEVAATDNTPAVERGVGNMVSAEFNLLYRFHPAISDRDDKWTSEFFRGIYGDKEPETIGIEEFYEGVAKYEAGIPKEPSERTFGRLKRDPKTGLFDDAGLVKILKESMEDPAGLPLPGLLLHSI